GLGRVTVRRCASRRRPASSPNERWPPSDPRRTRHDLLTAILHPATGRGEGMGMPWMSPPTLYKAGSVPTTQPVCAICVDRTRGKTERLQLTHRVVVWLCADHASPAFQTRRGGRD